MDILITFIAAAAFIFGIGVGVIIYGIADGTFRD